MILWFFSIRFRQQSAPLKGFYFGIPSRTKLQSRTKQYSESLESTHPLMHDVGRSERSSKTWLLPSYICGLFPLSDHTENNCWYPRCNDNLGSMLPRVVHLHLFKWSAVCITVYTQHWVNPCEQILLRHAFLLPVTWDGLLSPEVRLSELKASSKLSEHAKLTSSTYFLAPSCAEPRSHCVPCKPGSCPVSHAFYNLLIPSMVYECPHELFPIDKMEFRAFLQLKSSPYFILLDSLIFIIPVL